MNDYRLMFAYQPAAHRSSRLLLAVPPSRGHQTTELVDHGSIEPHQLLSLGENIVELYEVEPGQQVFREYRLSFAAPTIRDTGSTLSPFLRSSPLVDFGPRVRGLAAICRRSSIRETVRALYDTIVDRSTYSWPPERRGASAFLADWKGDCGQMSFAMTAVLRTLGIPARIVAGAFARPGLNAHAWLEVHDDGWFAVDAALGNLNPAARDSWFDFSPIDRVVFSYDCDLDVGSLRAPCGRTGLDIPCEGGVVNWGGSLLNGGVPYLQPGYPLIDEVLTKPLTIPVWDISARGRLA